MAGAIVIAGVAVYGLVKWWNQWPESEPERQPVRREPESQPERREETHDYAQLAAPALSAIFGVRILSEEEANNAIQNGNSRIKKLDFSDLFKIKPNDVDENAPLYYIPESAYDPQYDCDFTKPFEEDTECSRGDYPYKRPSGWKRKAVRVIGKYEDDVWLGPLGWRSESYPGEWPVSFHGTKMQNIHNIITGGYDLEKGNTFAYGVGIYSTPHFEVATKYATKFNYKGEDFKCILQNRVNLDETNVEDTADGPYFITPDADNIRPYGVCLKKM